MPNLCYATSVPVAVLFGFVLSILSCSENLTQQDLKAFRGSAKLPSDSTRIRYEEIDSRGSLIKQTILTEARKMGALAFASRRSTSTNLFNTPTENRINLVFIGDGYTAEQVQVYHADVDRIVAQIFAKSPLGAYRDFFTVHRVDVISNQSGVIDGSGPLGMDLGCLNLDRLLCINVESAMAEALNAPRVDFVFALANTREYGGAGYMDPPISTLSAKHPQSVELAIHEFGHSFAKLTDEYDYGTESPDCESFANTSLANRDEMLRLRKKWHLWFDLPHVGTFLGSCQSARFFRPTENSLMRSLGRPFQEINSEQIVSRIIASTRPLDQFARPGNYRASGELWVRPVQKRAELISVDWTINGSSLPELHGQINLNLRTAPLRRGRNSVQVTVRSNGPYVRDQNLLGTSGTQTINYSVQK